VAEQAVRPGEQTLTPGPGRVQPIDKDVLERVGRGRDRLGQIAPYVNEQLEHWRGHQYWYVDQQGKLQQQLSGPAGVRAAGKPSWRVREPHNMIFDFVAHEVSAASSRTPGYEVVPTTGDHSDASAAKMAERVAIYGHDKWDLEPAAIAALTHAVVTGEAFAWVYWDSNLGPFIEGTDVGLGDVCVEIYGKGQVYWEPGQKFDKSGWHAIDVAMTPDSVRRIPGYKGPKDPPTDADTASYVQRGYQQPERRMSLITYYLERPSADKPEGRWLTLMGNQEIAPARPYPGSGNKPCLHRLSYQVDPDSDRDMGLVEQLLPAQRQFNDATNKIIEWKNLHMMGGRIFVTPGALGQQVITDEPGRQYEVRGDPNQHIKIWEAPEIPTELFQIRDDALAEMARIAAQNDIPSQVESGKGIVTLTERDQSRRGTFLKQVARWYAGVMRSCLVQVKRYYTEDRLIAIKGDFGWESVDDFQGAMLSDNLDVRVNPASFEPLTRVAVEQRVIAFADRMWISPEVAMRAINTGSAENLLGSLERAESRVHRVIRRIKEGTVFDMGPRVVPAPPDPVTGVRMDPATGLPTMQVPGWMPLPWDNLRMWRSIFEDFFQTEYAETMEPPVQEAANLIYRQVLELEAQEAMLQQQRQMAMAEQAGLGNAAKPQGPPSSPDMPKLGAPEQQSAPTPNQPAAQSMPS
jgi:hypothetical protein